MGIFSGVGDFFTGVGGVAAGAGRGIYRGTGAVVDGITGKTAADAARDAANIQVAGAKDANGELGRQYDQNRADQSPWLNIGRQNLESLNSQMQAGSFNTQDPGQYDGGQYQDPGQFQYGEFNPGNLESDPGYQFRMSQGLKGIQNSRAGQGSLKSGATLKALMNYGQGQASQEYGAAFDRFNTNRNFAQGNFQDARNFGRNNFENNRNFGANQFQQSYQNRNSANMDRFNRLSAIAGTGQAAAQNLGAQGANYAQNYGNNVMGAANSQAAGRVGAANAYTGAFNNLLGTAVKGGIAAYTGGA